MKKLGLLFVVALATIAISEKMSQHGEVANELVMSNIEALATIEDVQYGYCVGSGEVDCPDGTKAEYVIGVYNLE